MVQLLLLWKARDVKWLLYGGIASVVKLLCWLFPAGGYSVLGWNHPGFGGSTVSSVYKNLAQLILKPVRLANQVMMSNAQVKW